MGVCVSHTHIHTHTHTHTHKHTLYSPPLHPPTTHPPALLPLHEIMVGGVVALPDAQTQHVHVPHAAHRGGLPRARRLLEEAGGLGLFWVGVGLGWWGMGGMGLSEGYNHRGWAHIQRKPSSNTQTNDDTKPHRKQGIYICSSHIQRNRPTTPRPAIQNRTVSKRSMYMSIDTISHNTINTKPHRTYQVLRHALRPVVIELPQLDHRPHVPLLRRVLVVLHQLLVRLCWWFVCWLSEGDGMGKGGAVCCSKLKQHAPMARRRAAAVIPPAPSDSRVRSLGGSTWVVVCVRAQGRVRTCSF